MTSTTCSAREDLLEKHRQEKKELRAKIQRLKKSINNDKKKKKEVAEQIASLEDEMKDRHAKELSDLDISHDTTENKDIEDSLDTLAVEDPEQFESKNDEAQCETKKLSRAQRRRDRKAAANKEKELKIKEEEENYKYSNRSVEAEKMKSLLKDKKLMMFEISPDGNCMYAAIAHQMQGEQAVEDLRRIAAGYMKDHADELACFVTNNATGDVLSSSEYSEYCKKVEETSAWGGEPELYALSQALKKKIEVIQAEGSSVIIGEQYSEPPIVLAYYQYHYGLGAHYNSVVPLSLEEPE